MIMMELQIDLQENSYGNNIKYIVKLQFNDCIKTYEFNEQIPVIRFTNMINILNDGGLLDHFSTSQNVDFIQRLYTLSVFNRLSFAKAMEVYGHLFLRR